MEKERHLIFSDESGWDNTNRYGSIALISGTYSNTKELNNQLKKVLLENDKKEIKFKTIKNKRNQSIANRFFQIGFNYLIQSRIKIHVIVWDKQDERHNIERRNDVENLKRMYYHNLKVLKKHWAINTNWEFYPDEFSSIDWEKDVVEYIRNTNFRKDNYQQDFFEILDSIEFPTVTNIRELKSEQYGIIQLADLYAGIIRTSRNESENFYRWYLERKKEGEPTLFETEKEEIKITNSLRYKYETMYDFKNQAEKNKMGLNLSESKYFKTFNKKNGLYIWHYEPQGDYDRAPTNRKKL